MFVQPPVVPVLRDVLSGAFNGIPYGLPPREICEDCGAHAGERHDGGCYYAGYPTLIANPAFRPTVARELTLPVTRCGVCRCPVLGNVDYDVKQHAWWCSWWDAHPDAAAPF